MPAFFHLPGRLFFYNNMAFIDSSGESIKINGDGLVKVDGIGVFRLIVREKTLFVQFCDHDRMRIQCRTTKFVEVPLEVLVAKINPINEKPDETMDEKKDEEAA